MKQEHKDYIIKNNINSVEELKKHLQHLSDYRHTLTKDGEQMLKELSELDKDSVLIFFAAEELKRINATRHKSINGETHLKKEEPPTEHLTSKIRLLEIFAEDAFNKQANYVFSWRPNKETESTLNTKPVHSNPFVDENYCPRKKRIEDAERLKNQMIQKLNLESPLLKAVREEGNKCSDMPSHSMERGNIIDYGSPLAPKQKDKITTEDLKVFKKPEVKDCTIKDGKVEYGVKESQTVKKAPIFTYCKQMKNALEQLAFRSEYGHNKYLEYDADYNNFARVPNGDEEYGNAMFRHALNIGEDSELDHYVAQAWDAVARLEIYLRNKKLKNS